jgi:bifunctional DNA-binding transcriptional regulator/antitoxin component of YhaV-PrlF toxin-antitoxin module
VVDDHGRVADRAVLRALGWSAGTRVDIRETGGLLLIQSDPGGVFQTTRKGHLQLPIAVRRWCAITPGDRLLLVAVPNRRRLVVHTLSDLDVVVGARHDALLAGEVG